MHALARALHSRVADRRRVDNYYAPLAIACESRVRQSARRPCIVGLQGPQGGGKTTLATALVALGPGDEALVPLYDKSAHRGRGDRAPRDRWRRVAGPLDLILVDGWMLGFSPAPQESVGDDLRAPNGYLGAYADWPAKLDMLVRLDVCSLETIVRWRVDAERARRARGEAGLSDDDARDYIERFLPAYEVYVPQLRTRPPCRDVVEVVLGDDRMPLEPLR